MSPRSYTFTRPFDSLNRNYANVSIGSARQLNGQHFSMADHRREYPILGIKPNHLRRNTYRLDPSPWDADLIDVPPNQQMEDVQPRSEEHTSELQSLMRISYAVFCLKKKNKIKTINTAHDRNTSQNIKN